MKYTGGGLFFMFFFEKMGLKKYQRTNGKRVLRESKIF